MTKTFELPAMTPAETKVAAKVLYQMGWGARKVEEWLGVSDDTVLRAKEAPTPEEMRQFETDFTSAIQDMKKEGVALVHKRLKELIPKERRIEAVVKAGEFLEGRKNESGPVVNIGAKADEMSITIE